ncbi:MAG: Na+:solute symporter [Cyclobacteriaceae bacterium]|nr:Na+:solute symporter [Cyclobacteriaceae bacterium]
MYLAWADLAVIVFFLGITLYIGLYFRKKASKDINSFFLGGQNLAWYVAGTSMVATTFAADTPLAVTELISQGGIASNWLWWNMLAGGMLTVFFFSRYWRKAGIVTDNELIEIRYSGRPAAFLRGFRAIYLGAIMNAIIIAWVNVAMVAILKVFFDLDQSTALWITFGLMLITAFYSSLSGLLGVVYSDVIQFITALVGCIILAVLIIKSPEIGGIQSLKSQLPNGTTDFFPRFSNNTGSNVNTFSIGIASFFAFIGFQWWASWYPGNEPGGGGYIAQRIMSTKDESHAIKATFFFQIAHYCIRPWPWIIVGLCAIVLYPEIQSTDPQLGFIMAMKDFLPAGLKGLLLVAFISAYMSTLSTQLNWGTSYLVNDFYLRFFKTKPTSKRKEVLASRVITLALMIWAAFVSTKINSVSQAWQILIEGGAGLGLVLILRWFWYRVTAWSEIAATVTPFLAYLFVHVVLVRYDTSWAQPITIDPKGFYFIIFTTTIVWVLVTLLSPPEDKQHLLKFYRLIQPLGYWKPISGEGSGTKKIVQTIIIWLAAVVLCYAVLFGIGSLILQYWNRLTISIVVGVISFMIFRFMSRKVRIFEL